VAFKCPGIEAKPLKIFRLIRIVQDNTAAAGGDVTTNYRPAPEQRGFSTADILWAIGIWSVILCLSPVIVFYVLMVA